MNVTSNFSDLKFVDKQTIASLLPMGQCIDLMEKMFLSLAKGTIVQPLRSMMWVPDKRGLLGLMPGYAGDLEAMGVKLISVFHGNTGFPSHQGLVVLFNAKNGRPIMTFDATEITAIRTAAVSALATRVLSRRDSEVLAIIGSGEQANRHIESIAMVRKIKEIRIWSRNEQHAMDLVYRISNQHAIPVTVKKLAREAVESADIICTVTSSPQPLLAADWIAPGTHINAVGSGTPSTRELDTQVIVHSKLFADCYESIFNEAGDFLIPKKEGAITDAHVRAELGEILSGSKKGRESEEEVTVFKSLGIAAEDIYAAWHVFQKLENPGL